MTAARVVRTGHDMYSTYVYICTDMVPCGTLAPRRPVHRNVTMAGCQCGVAPGGSDAHEATSYCRGSSWRPAHWLWCAINWSHTGSVDGTGHKKVAFARGIHFHG